MKRFKNVLVAYNDAIGAEDALKQAAALARTNRARLTLIEISSAGQGAPMALQRRQKRLQRMILALRRDGAVDVSARMRTGSDFIEIIRQVLRDGHDLVIASAEAGNSVRNVFYGSTATHLMRKCPCPVWIVKPRRTLPYARILAAVDPDLENPAEDALNGKIMDLATSLAMAHEAELHVFHSWDVTGEDRDTLRAPCKDTTRHMLLAKHERLHRAGVDALLKKFPLSHLRHVVHLARGFAEQQIEGIAERLEIDVIVMGTTGRSGLPALLVGNGAETILSAAKCGVLTVKPEGFESPIRLQEELAAA